MEWPDFIKIIAPLVLFFWSMSFWLLKRQDRKAGEDKATFQDIYRQLVALKEKVAYLEGKRDARANAANNRP